MQTKYNAKILIVDDEEINLFILEKLLKNVEAKTIKANDAFEALDRTRENEFALMILDVQMPRMDGFELARKIREMPENQFTPIIFISAIFTDPDSISKGYVTGAVDYLTKPANPNILRSKVNVFLELYNQRKELQENISRRELVEQELRTLNETLEKRVKEEIKKYNESQQLLIQKSKLESLGEIAAGIAHEINQPLAGISMAIDNLVFQYSDGSLSNDYFNNKANYIFEDIKRIKQIIDHVRTFSRDQAKETKELINLETTIKDALSMVSTQYKNHQVNIETVCETGCYAYGNKYKLEQVLLNILSNSKHALDKKQQSTNNPDFKKNIDVILVKNRSHNIIKIKDNGTGISKKNLEMIFNPFFTTKNVNEGTGLGLSISFGIIKEMDGDIEVETKENEYTLMKIILPLADTR